MAVRRRKSVVSARPLLGIVTCRCGFKITKRRPFAGQTARFRRLCEDARKLGLDVAVFYAEDIHPASDQINGMTYSARKRKWISKAYRFPDVVYNRIPSRKREANERIASVLDAVSRLGIPLFNTRYLNKLEVYRAAKKSPKLASHVPDTRRLREAQDLYTMLAKYNAVYVKRSDGTLGNGISAVSKVGKKYVIRKNVGHKVLESKLTKSQVTQVIAGYVKRKRYLVQQGLDLVTYNGRPLDFRVMVQKRGDGKWRVTGIGTRVAGPNQITTHVPRGGTKLSFRKGIECAVGDNQKSARVLTRQIRRLCCATARQVEKSLDLHLAEASFDIGVDTAGRIWLIEMNSKPFVFDEKRIQAKASRYLLDYVWHVIRSGRTSARLGEV